MKPPVNDPIEAMRQSREKAIKDGDDALAATLTKTLGAQLERPAPPVE